MEQSEVINTDPITPVEKLEKRRNTSFGLSLSNTFYHSRIVCPKREDPREIGGGSCSNCGVIVPHDDLVGIPESRWFKVYGYHCHACGYRWMNPKRAKEEERKGQKYMTMGKWEIKRSPTISAEEIELNDEKNDLFINR